MPNPHPMPVAVPPQGATPPTITITLRQLLDAQPALQRLSAEKLPVKLSYTVARLLRALQPELDDFFRQREALVKEYGVKRPATEAEKVQHGDEVLEVPPENMPAFRKDVDEIADLPLHIDRAPLKLDGFPDISPADMLALAPLLEDAL